MLSRDNILEEFKLSNKQFLKIESFIQIVKNYNKHTNIVGKSTLVDPWRAHILDSLQICNFIPNKKCSILDMGTGAGIPGLILAMHNYSNISIVDSNSKKINFVKYVCFKLNINATIYKERIETLANIKFDFLISRALANLNKLFYYSQGFLKKNTILVFLKGITVKKELTEAQKSWQFKYTLKQSLSDKRGSVLIVSALKKING